MSQRMLIIHYTEPHIFSLLLLGILLCWYTCRAFQRHKNDFQKEL